MRLARYGGHGLIAWHALEALERILAVMLSAEIPPRIDGRAEMARRLHAVAAKIERLAHSIGGACGV